MQNYFQHFLINLWQATQFPSTCRLQEKVLQSPGFLLNQRHQQQVPGQKELGTKWCLKPFGVSIYQLKDGITLEEPSSVTFALWNIHLSAQECTWNHPGRTKPRKHQEHLLDANTHPDFHTVPLGQLCSSSSLILLITEDLGFFQTGGF